MPKPLSTLALAALAAALVAPSALARPALAQTNPAEECGADPTQPPVPAVEQDDDALLAPIGTYKTGGFDGSGAEIVTFDPDTDRVFTVNSVTSRVDVLDASDPADPTIVGCLDLGGPPTSTAALGGGFAAVAYQAEPKTDPGFVVIVDENANEIATVRVGSAVDALTVTPDLSKVLTANEGEWPDDLDVTEEGYEDTIPDGSVSVIDLPDDLATLTQDDVTTVGFTDLERADLDPDIRQSRLLRGETITVAQDFEPEYVVADEDSELAYVSLQESSGLAVLDLETLEFTDVFGLPVVDHDVAGNEISPTDRPLGEPDRRLDPAETSTADAEFATDANTGLGTYDVVGMPMPDGIAVRTVDGTPYVLTAEEGDAREWGDVDAGTGFLDESRVGDLGDVDLEPCDDVYDDEDAEILDRLNVSRDDGVREGEGCIEQLHAYGTRGMGVYDATSGERVFHTGSDLERAGIAQHPRFLNSDHAAAGYLDRSDSKGPEPEYVELGQVGSRTLAFLGLERSSAIAVYDVTDPTAPTFLDYVWNRDFEAQLEDPEDPLAGDLGPEGLEFVAAEDSPSGEPLLVVGNEVSGTTTIWQIDVDEVPTDPTDPTTGRVQRIGGDGRVATAIAASQDLFGDGEAGAVVLARADVYADALAGTPVATSKDAPLLLTATDALDPAVADEIERVLPPGGTVFVLGGQVALDDAVSAAVEALGHPVERLAGLTRVETAIAIAQQLGDPDEVLLTTGFDFPDAFSAGAAAQGQRAVLLTAGATSTPTLDAYLEANDPTTFAVGGPAATAFPDAARVVGATRAGTAVAVADRFFDDPAVAGVARSDDFPDALVGGAHVAALGGPLLLTASGELPEETAGYLERTDSIRTAFVYGGTDAVAVDVEDALRDVLTAGETP